MQQGLRRLHRQRQSQRFGGWRLPEDALDLLAVDMKRLMTKAERDRAADGPRQLTAGEIVKFYRDGIGGVKISVDNDRHRIWFLLGLFAGQGQKQLGTIRRDEFFLEAATLTHQRNKTSVQGVYWLPPELVKMLREYFRRNTGGGDGLAFHTGEGRPLVDDRCDAVRLAWDDWRKRSQLDLPSGLGFYALRRFFGDYATRVGGDAVGDAALAHTAKSVRGKYYSGFRDFDKVREAGQRLHAELTAAGMFATVPSQKKGRG